MPSLGRGGPCVAEFVLAWSFFSRGSLIITLCPRMCTPRDLPRNSRDHTLLASAERYVELAVIPSAHAHRAQWPPQTPGTPALVFSGQITFFWLGVDVCRRSPVPIEIDIRPRPDP